MSISRAKGISHEIPMVQYRPHDNDPQDPILNQTNPTHIVTFRWLKPHLHVFLGLQTASRLPVYRQELRTHCLILNTRADPARY